MRLVRAFYAFCRHLFGAECEHAKLRDKFTHGHKAGGFCTDCGYKVAMMWAMLRCRNCVAKRTPRKNLDGSIGPMYRYCEHCGSTDFQIIKKSKLHSHEMPYAVMCAEVDYSEEQPRKKVYAAPKTNPFAAYSGSVVDGEVVSSEYLHV